MRVKLYDKEQLDLVEAQAIADSAEDNGFDLVKALLFSGDYRIEGGNVNEDSPVSGVVKVDPGVFVKADGKFYSMASTATANILTGTEDQPANVWGTGQAADPTNPRKDIIVVNFQFTESGSALKDFVDDTVTPPVFYNQTVNTRKNPAPTFSIIHGTPSATPSEPAIPSGFLKLATIYVAAAVTTILDADITNNLNINLKTLEKLQLASQAASAFSDRLHSDGVYAAVNGELEVTETSPQSMGVSVATGVSLKDGTTANLNTQTTVPIDAASFVNKPAEVVDFSGGDTQPLLCDGTPPHKIRPGTYLVTGTGGAPPYADTVDYTIDLVNATITRLGGGSIPGGGSVEVTYDYFLPRIDVVEILMANSTPQTVLGTPAHTPVAPTPSPNAMFLAEALVGEGVTVIVDANITDKRIYLPDLDELVAARGGYASIDARLIVDEAAIGANGTNLTNHMADNITPANMVHGIQQGSGNGFDADKLDAQEGSFYLARANHSGVQAPSTISPQGSGSALNADQVDGYHADSTPTPSTLLPLDGGGKYPVSVIPNLVGNYVRSKLDIEVDGATPTRKLNITADLLSIDGLILPAVSVSADITILGGANGLDAGVEAVSTWYRVFVITNNDGTLVAGLLSTSAAPSLPVGYTKYARVGWVRNDAAGNFIAFHQIGERVLYYDRILNVQTWTSTISLTVSFASFIPPGILQTYFDASVGASATSTGGQTPSASIAQRIDATHGPYSTVVSCADFDAVSGSLATGSQSSAFIEVSATQTLDLSISINAANGGSAQIYVVGYIDPA